MLVTHTRIIEFHDHIGGRFFSVIDPFIMFVFAVQGNLQIRAVCTAWPHLSNSVL